MACNKCTKVTGMEYNETFFSLNYKELNALAQPWYVHFNFRSHFFNFKYKILSLLLFQISLSKLLLYFILLFRSRVDVELHDTTGSLVTSLFGDDAEKFMTCSTTKLMLETTQVLYIYIYNTKYFSYSIPLV